MFKPQAPCSQPKNVIAKQEAISKEFFAMHFIICEAYSIVRKHNDKTERTKNATSIVALDWWSSQIYHRHIRCWWWWWHCTGRVPLLIYCLRQSNHGWRPPRWASQRHPILHFTIKATEKYSTAMYYAPHMSTTETRPSLPEATNTDLFTACSQGKMIFLSHIESIDNPLGTL